MTAPDFGSLKISNDSLSLLYLQALRSDTAINRLIEKRQQKAEEFFDDDDQAAFGAFTLLRKKSIEFRVANNLNTWRESYNQKLLRQLEEFRLVNNTSHFQVYYGAGKKVTAGLSFAYRSSVIGGNESGSLLAFEFRKNNSSSHALRSISGIVRTRIGGRKLKVSGQTSFAIPLADEYAIAYNEYVYRDNNTYQWLTQVFFRRDYSKWVKLIAETNFNVRSEQDLKLLTATFRSPVRIVFSGDPLKSLYLFGLMEFNPSYTNGFMYAFQMREAAGLRYYLSPKLTGEFTFSYIFLGKRVAAATITLLAIRYRL